MYQIREKLFIFLFAIAVLAPSIPITSTFSMRPEILIVSALFAVALAAKGKFLVNNSSGKWFFIISLNIMLSILYAELFLRNTLNFNDAFEVIKVVVYYMTYFIALSNKIDIIYLRKVYACIFIIFIVSAILGIMQYFDVYNYNSIITPLYATSQLEGVLK